MRRAFRLLQFTSDADYTYIIYESPVDIDSWDITWKSCEMDSRNRAMISGTYIRSRAISTRRRWKDQRKILLCKGYEELSIKQEYNHNISLFPMKRRLLHKYNQVYCKSE